jgi:hypothetical protein
MSRRAPLRELGKNGCCIVCGKERPAVAIKHRDPFCSAVCSRKHHGTRDVWVKGVED